MFLVDRLILIGAALLVTGIVSSRLSTRLGLPVLVLFLCIGLMAGAERFGGIVFDDYALAHGIGTLALAVILFDGGLRSSAEAFRTALAPGLTLATAGVVVTAVVTAWIAHGILDLPVFWGLLLGSIVSSTDAAAVLSTLRSRDLHLRRRIAATLEVEGGSNDPMAIFLTVAMLELVLGRIEPGPALVQLFLLQMSVGAVAGVLVGKAAVGAINRVDLDAAGLYPVLATAIALLAFGVASVLGGSGFLSVYLTGIILGNSRLVAQRGIHLFHDGAAWMAQVTMFVLLGLLADPARLVAIAPQGLLLSAVVLFISRPVAVGALLPWFGYRAREIAIISWVGLKGAVPIVLALSPLLLGVEGGETLFDVVFYVVIVSAILQGWSLPPLARLLGVKAPPEPEPPVTLEITSLRHVEGDIVDYTVTPDSRAAGRALRDLRLPDGAVVAMIVRGQRIIPPRGSTRIEPHDHAFLVLGPGVRPLVDRVFGRAGVTRDQLPARTEFALRGDTTLAELEEFYGITIGGNPERTLAQLLRDEFGPAPAAGAALEIGGVTLYIREIADGRIERVGLEIVTEEEGVPTPPGAHDHPRTGAGRPEP